MNFLTSLENTSFKKIFGLTLVIGLVLATPITVWVSQKETRLASKALFEKPEVIKPIKKYGALSGGEPRIDLVWPFLGKPGDAVLIEGENFGQNPQDKKLMLGNLVIPEENLEQWTPALIEFYLPQGASSSNLQLQVGGKNASWPYFFTIYGLETKTQVTENNDIVRVLNAPPGAKIEIFFSDKTKMESEQVNEVNIPADKTIISVMVKNKNGQPLPFFVEPEEFGF